MGEQQPLFRFVCIADVQYADKDDTFLEGRQQRYREAPGKLQKVIDICKGMPDLRFLLHCGDIIDGNDSHETTMADLQKIHAIFCQLKIPQYHVIGNHCLAAGRAPLLKALGMSSPYYAVDVAPGWLLVVLDSTDMNGYLDGYLHYDCGPSAVEDAKAYMASHPMEQYPQMNPWNGGPGTVQCRWFEATLQAASAAKKQVIVSQHHPVGWGCCRPTHMAWNWKEMHEMMARAGCVRLVLHGHDHEGGFATVPAQDGIHYLTMPGLVEAPPDGNAYAVISVRASSSVAPGSIHIEGHGLERVLALQPC